MAMRPSHCAGRRDSSQATGPSGTIDARTTMLDRAATTARPPCMVMRLAGASTA